MRRAALPRLDQRGASRQGCLVTLLLLAVAGYYGTQIGGAYLRYWQLLDEMQVVARYAGNLDDATIRRRLEMKTQELGLPPSASRFVIHRSRRRGEIRIATAYEETIELPFTTYQLAFHPDVRWAR